MRLGTFILFTRLSQTYMKFVVEYGLGTFVSLDGTLGALYTDLRLHNFPHPTSRYQTPRGTCYDQKGTKRIDGDDEARHALKPAFRLNHTLQGWQSKVRKVTEKKAPSTDSRRSARGQKQIAFQRAT